MTDPRQGKWLLQEVERLPPEATGMLQVREAATAQGVVFVQAGKVCWAVSHGMRGRLTDLLLQRTHGRVDRQRLEAVFHRCKEAGEVLGEALVAEGIVSARGLRDALRSHTCESLLALSACSDRAVDWAPHGQASFDARFTFTPVELCVALGASQHPDRATAACARLGALPDGTPGLACLGPEGGLVIAQAGLEHLEVEELERLGRWTSETADLALALGPELRASLVSTGQGGVFTWADGPIRYAALCQGASEIGQLIASRRRS